MWENGSPLAKERQGGEETVKTRFVADRNMGYFFLLYDLGSGMTPMSMEY
jgi:hypothetical protein